MLRAAAGRIVGVGGGIAGPVQQQQQQQQAACSACKTLRKFSMAKVAGRYACTCQREGGGNVVLPVSTGPQTTLNCSWEFLNEWEFSEEETNNDNFGHHPFRDRVVFGAAPTIEEVEEAVSDLQGSLAQSILYPSGSQGHESSSLPTAVQKNGGSIEVSQCSDSESESSKSVVDWIEPELYLYNHEVVQQLRQNDVLDAFRLLQRNHTVREMVISLVSDKAIWDALLKNEKVVEFRELLHKGETKLQEITEGSDENPADKPNWFSQAVQSAKLKVVEIINHILGFADKKIFSENDGEILDRTVKSSLMLAVVVLLVVLVKRV